MFLERHNYSNIDSLEKHYKNQEWIFAKAMVKSISSTPVKKKLVTLC